MNIEIPNMQLQFYFDRLSISQKSMIELNRISLVLMIFGACIGLGNWLILSQLEVLRWVCWVLLSVGFLFRVVAIYYFPAKVRMLRDEVLRTGLFDRLGPEQRLRYQSHLDEFFGNLKRIWG